MRHEGPRPTRDSTRRSWSLSATWASPRPTPTPSRDVHGGGLRRQGPRLCPGNPAAAPGSASERVAQNRCLQTFRLAALGGQKCPGPRAAVNAKQRPQIRPRRGRVAAQSGGGKFWARPTCSAFVQLLAPLVEARLRGGSRSKCNPRPPPSLAGSV